MKFKKTVTKLSLTEENDIQVFYVINFIDLDMKPKDVVSNFKIRGFNVLTSEDLKIKINKTIDLIAEDWIKSYEENSVDDEWTPQLKMVY